MHNSANSPRLNKVKDITNQIPIPYNVGINILSAPNQLGQLQSNNNFINNATKINEVPVFQYHRTNFKIKTNNQEINRLKNCTLQSHPVQNSLNSNFHIDQVRKTCQKKMYKTQQNDSGKPLSLESQTHKSVEQNCKKSMDCHIEHDNVKYYKIKPAKREYKTNLCNNKINSKSIRNESITYKNEEERNLSNCAATSTINLLSSDIKNKINDQQFEEYEVVENNGIQKEQDKKQVFNLNHSDSSEVQTEDVTEKSIVNAKEKTPMCLINDLARFNKISFQYRLTSENGPAHCKRFTVTLKLGDEEYTAEGFKIKNAQHLTAEEAIRKTKYKHPIPKTNRNDDNVVKSNITPTVELNALAMKLGQQTYYIYDPKEIDYHENNFRQNEFVKTNYKLNCHKFESARITQKPPPMNNNLNNKFFTQILNNDKNFQNMNEKKIFLSKYQNRCLPNQNSFPNLPHFKMNSIASTHFPVVSPCKITLIVGSRKFEGSGRTIQQAKHNAASNALQVLKEQKNIEEFKIQNETINDNNKSPVSLVFEIGIKRNLPVEFKVLKEEGPAHMRSFITACIVGDLITEGEGTGKKISKKKAAQKMLEELKKLPPIVPIISPIKKVKLKMSSKKCGSSQIKNLKIIESNEESERQWNKNKKLITESDAANPITKLMEWHQNQKEKEPVFKLINENGKENSRRHQFIMEVSSSNIVARGIGHSKKLAKREAAQNFLDAVSGQDQRHSNSKTGETKTLEIRKETDVETEGGEVISNSKIVTSSQKVVSNEPHNSSILKNIPSKSQNHMKDQLMYLAKLSGFEVVFSDYPKGNHNEFLTIVMLSTNPPQICHGVGINVKESQEDAAKNALKILSEMGLNNAICN